MNLKEMRDEVVQTLGLQDIDAYDESGIVNRYLNRGVLDLLSRTRCVVRCVHLRTQAGVDTYTLAHGILSLVDVEDGAQRLRRDERDAYGWDGVVYPYGSGSWREGFTLIRSDVLRIPKPDQDGEIDVWAVLRPAPMTADTHDVGTSPYGEIPDEFQDAIVMYALWRGSDYADDASGGMGERYRVDYEGQDKRGGRLREIKVMVNKRGTARFARSQPRPSLSSRGAWVG